MDQELFKIPYGKQKITKEDIEAVVKVLKSEFLTQGPKIPEFEKKFASYIGAKYAVAVSSGTAALHICSLAQNIKPGQRVITTPITFVATANCVKYCGGEIEFVDIDPETYLIDLYQVKRLLENHPKNTYQGIISVDFAGYPVNMEKLGNLAMEYGLWIIEDACHAPGGYFVDETATKQYCGNGKFADLAIFSFHPVKHIATGEGGMVTTNNYKLYKTLLRLRTHGITKDTDRLIENHGGWYYEMQDLGYNYRLTDIQGALGISQLSRADENIMKRREIAKGYDDAFIGTLIKTTVVKPGFYHACHLYIIRVPNRKGLYEYLRNHDIYTQVHYIPVHLQPYYRKFGWGKGDFPNAEDYYSSCLSLPIYPTLTHEQQQYVIDRVLEFVT